MRLRFRLRAFIMLMMVMMPIVAAAQNTVLPPKVTGQVTFLYFKDLEKASAFYGKLLGAKPSLDLDWVKIYPLSPASSVGLVNATRGSHRPSADKPVMVSLVVGSGAEVDRWHARVTALGAPVKSPPKLNELAPGKGVRAFSFTDPEGYTLEVFAWVDR